MKLTKFQALYIKYMNIRLEYSDRRIAECFKERYNTFPNMGKQMYGNYLVSEAMKLLNETVEDGWN